MKPEKKYWLDDPANIRRMYIGLWITCLLLLVADLFYHPHGHFGWDERVGFFSVFGFLACTGLIMASKGLRRIVMRDEDYYDR